GNVLHTGDFKLDQTPIDGVRTDFAALSRFAEEGIDLLMSDSTNANVPEFTKSEAEVGKVLSEIIENAKRRVVVASFASHIHRIQQICDATVHAGRKVAVTGRSMLTNTRIARELGYLQIDDSDIVDAYMVKDVPRDKLVVLCTGSQGEPLSALTRIANGEHRTIDIEPGDTVIISASPVPGNEKAVNRVKNALAKVGVDFYDKSRARVHVSGHAAMEELKIVMSICRPRNFMPIHGEAQHLQAHAKLAEAVGIPKSNIFILENGNTLELLDGKAELGESVDSGVVFVEGLSVGDVSTLVLKDRKTLANEGVATVVIMISKRDGRPLGDVEVIMRGVSGGDDAGLLDDATATVQDTISKLSHDYRLDPRSLRREVYDSLSKFLWNRCRRRPMIIPIIMEV
ncbi:MAG: ribonuclease J, partial [Coriobacteriales bacterium]